MYFKSNETRIWKGCLGNSQLCSTSNPQHTQCSQYMPGEKVRWPGYLTTINLRCVQFLISLVSGISMALWKAWEEAEGINCSVEDTSLVWEDIFEKTHVLSTEEALPSLTHLVVVFHHLQMDTVRKAARTGTCSCNSDSFCGCWNHNI